jgi:hypothetical protein
MHADSLLDLGNGFMVIKNANPADIRALLIAGRGSIGGAASGKWNGTSGITSTPARLANSISETRALGFAVNGQLLVRYQTFAGIEVDADDILIRYTKPGDANLDGVVNNNDITILAGNYRPGAPGKLWHNADFNYDGETNNNDITTLAGYYKPDEPPVTAAHQSGQEIPVSPFAQDLLIKPQSSPSQSAGGDVLDRLAVDVL